MVISFVLFIVVKDESLSSNESKISTYSNSGIYFLIGSSKSISPFSHNFTTPKDVIALVMEAILKISSFLNSSLVSGFFIP